MAVVAWEVRLSSASARLPSLMATPFGRCSPCATVHHLAVIALVDDRIDLADEPRPDEHRALRPDRDRARVRQPARPHQSSNPGGSFSLSIGMSFACLAMSAGACGASGEVSCSGR